MNILYESINDFINHCLETKDLSQKTIAAYRADLIQLSTYIIKNTPDKTLSEIDKNVMKAYFDHMEENYKPKTVKRKLATLRAFFCYLEYEDQILVSPFRKLNFSVKNDRPSPTLMSLIEVKMLLNYAYRYLRGRWKVSEHAHKIAARDVAILELLFGTGIRVSELCKLKKSSVDLEQRSIHVQSTRERIIPLCGLDLLAALANYIRLYRVELEHSDYFFINRLQVGISDQSVRLLVKKYASNAGIGKHITPQTLRHTVTTMLMNSGMDVYYVQYLMGHASIFTTRGYEQLDQDGNRQNLFEKHPRLQVNAGFDDRAKGY